MKSLYALCVMHNIEVPNLHQLPVKTAAEIDKFVLFSTLGFGHTSLGFLAFVLAKEVVRLEKQLESVRAALQE